MRTLMRSLALAFLAMGLLPSAAAQQAIFLVRHAEKLAEEMQAIDTPLSKAGKARARLLAETLKDAGITVIYASRAVRTQDTAAPLARALGLEVKIIDQDRPQPVVERLRSRHSKDVVLIVGHSDTLPDILNELGYAPRIKIRSWEYTNLFLVIPRGDKPPSLLRLRFGEDQGESSARRKSPPPPRSKPSPASQP